MLVRVMIAILGLAGCGRIDFDPLASRLGDDAAGVGGDAMVGFGTGTIAGTGCMGTTFNTIGAAYSVGHPEIAGQPEIYLFDQPIPCNAMGIAVQAWDQTNAALFNNVQVMSFVIGGTGAADFSVSFVDPPTFGTAFAQYYDLMSPGAYTACEAAAGGDLSVTAINNDLSVDGTYAITIQGTGAMVAGGFHAVFCAAGWYAVTNRS